MRYDDIGKTYTATRRADPRIAAAIDAALGNPATLINVGAGAGAYEPDGRTSVAVEPSLRMIGQRKAGMAPVVRAVAEALPFRSNTFDAALAVLTLHHWKDWRRGLDEMRRVASRLVLFTFEPADVGNFWLTADYFPEIVAMDRERAPSIMAVANHLGRCDVQRVPIPHDCVDGFLAAFWRRPEVYLDPGVRASMSAFALLDEVIVNRGVARLRADLESGVWEQRFGEIRALESLDVCYRLIVSG